MIFFAGSDGSVLRIFPSVIRQGSSNADVIYLIAPFAKGVQVSAAFRLPDGRILSETVMTPLQEVAGVVDEKTGSIYAGWMLKLPASVAERAGNAAVQFFFHLGEEQAVVASERVEFSVARGIVSDLPEAPTAEVYETILGNISALSANLVGGLYAARAVFAWNADAVYDMNEICYVSDAGERGAFVRSKINGNKIKPYTDGVLSEESWEEEVNFAQLYAAFETAERHAAEAASSAASAAENGTVAADGARDALGYAESAKSSAEDAAGFSSQAQTYAREAAQAVTDIDDTLSGMIGGLVTKDEFQKLIDGETSVARATHADTADKTANSLNIVIDGETVKFTGEEEKTITLNTSTSVDSNAVHFTPQELSEQSKEQARANIGAQVAGSYQPSGDYVTNDSMNDALAKKADVSGNYSGLTAGFATSADTATRADTAERAEKDGDGNSFSDTYAKQTGTYANMTVGNALNAQTADKATKDGNGNVFSNVYAKQTGVYSGITAGSAVCDGQGHNIVETYSAKHYLHRISLDLSDEFHIVFFMTDKDKTEITAGELTRRIYAAYQTNELPASGFCVNNSTLRGWVYSVNAVSDGGQLKVRAAYINDGVQDGSYNFSVSTGGCIDFVTEI